MNCLRTLPHIRRWHEVYKDKGLVIIGVHTPEFAFEKKSDNVSAAIRDLNIKYPVILDPNYDIWKLFANRSWPHKYLLNHEGYIIYDHAGEGAYGATELAIQDALKEIGAKDLPAIGPDGSEGGRVCYRTTNETYLGFLRGHIGNDVEIFPDAEEAFTDNESKKEKGTPYVHGHWRVAGEYVEHTRRTSGANEYLRLDYEAFSVNLVMEIEAGKTAVVEVELNNQPLSADMAGEDVIFERGKSVVLVREPRMYRLVKAGQYHQGSLKVKTDASGLRAYAYTFGGC